MSERIFLRLNDKLALGADGLQWILLRSSKNKATGAVKWQPFSYVRSTKAILLRCIRESGLVDEWKAAQHSRHPARRDVSADSEAA